MKMKFFIGLFTLLLATPMSISATEPCFENAACDYSAAEIDFNNDMSHPAALISPGYAAAAYTRYSNTCDAILAEFNDCLDRNGW